MSLTALMATADDGGHVCKHWRWSERRRSAPAPWDGHACAKAGRWTGTNGAQRDQRRRRARFLSLIYAGRGCLDEIDGIFPSVCSGVTSLSLGVISGGARAIGDHER